MNRSMACLVVMLLAGSPLRASGPSAGKPGPWDHRLSALDPAEPLAYFELAEEVADQARDESEQGLAIRLFALAGILDADRLGASACLGLLQVIDDPVRRRRLEAVLELLDDGTDLVAQAGRDPDTSVSSSAALAVSVALGRYRRGDAVGAIRRLKGERGAIELLRRSGGDLDSIRRLVDALGQARPSITAIFTPRELTSMLQVEVSVLGRARRSWSSDLLVTRARPIVLVELDDLGTIVGVETAKSVYRDGWWDVP